MITICSTPLLMPPQPPFDRAVAPTACSTILLQHFKLASQFPDITQSSHETKHTVAIRHHNRTMSLLTPTATAALRAAARPCLAPSLRHLPTASRPLTTLLRPVAPRALASPPARARRASTAAAEPQTPTLDWDTYFQLRKTRRRIQVLFSVGGGAAGGTAGSYLLASGAAEPLVGLIPLDPFFTMGLMAFASATLGWLLGPIVGSGVFNMWHRKIRPQMAAVGRCCSRFRVGWRRVQLE